VSEPLPVLAEVTRGPVVEGHHHGSVIAVRADGSVAVRLGRPDEPMLPRSSAKPLQAVGMLRAGLEVDDEELALACASHSGQPEHVAVVRRLLSRYGLEERDLDNTPGMPLHGGTRRDLIRAGEGPSRITHNCSGKHAAMLATCVAAGWPTSGYRDPGHPLQQSLRGTVEELTGDRVAATVVDGCGAPLFAVSLRGLARSFGRLGRCASVMRTHPFLVGGEGRDVTTLMSGVPGLVAKDGAEGVYAAGFDDGPVVAVKIDDGSDRARMPVLVAALRALGVESETFEEFATVPVLGHGEPVGSVHVVF
jgi:L-asparaginase II